MDDCIGDCRKFEGETSATCATWCKDGTYVPEPQADPQWVAMCINNHATNNDDKVFNELPAERQIEQCGKEYF